MYFYILIVVFMYNSIAFAQERIDDKTYMVTKTETRNLDDQKAHCQKLQEEINRLTDEQKQCIIEVDNVDKQPVPKTDEIVNP